MKVKHLLEAKKIQDASIALYHVGEEKLVSAILDVLDKSAFITMFGKAQPRVKVEVDNDDGGVFIEVWMETADGKEHIDFVEDVVTKLTERMFAPYMDASVTTHTGSSADKYTGFTLYVTSS
jgi:hypothetical protein